MKNKMKAGVLALGMLYGLSGDVKATTSQISSDLAKNLIENPVSSPSSDEMLDAQTPPMAAELPDYKTLKKQFLEKYPMYANSSITLLPISSTGSSRHAIFEIYISDVAGKQKNMYQQRNHYFIFDQNSSTYYKIPYGLSTSYKEITDLNKINGMISTFFPETKNTYKENNKQPQVFVNNDDPELFIVMLNRKSYIVHSKSGFVVPFSSSFSAQEGTMMLRKFGFLFYSYDSSPKKEMSTQFEKIKNTPYLIKPVVIGDKKFYEIYFGGNEYCYIVDNSYQPQFPEVSSVLKSIKEYSPVLWNIYKQYLGMICEERGNISLNYTLFPNATTALFVMNSYAAINKIISTANPELQSSILQEMRTNDKIYANDPIKKQRIQTLWHSYGIAVGRAAERSQQRYEVERMRFLIIYLHKLVEKNGNIFDLNRYHEIQSDVRLPFSNHLDKKSLLGTWYTSLSTADKQAAVNYAYIKCYLSVTDE